VTVPGVVALAAAPGGYVVALAAVEGCAGVQAAPLSPALELGALGECVASTAGPGTTTLAAGGDVLWIWSGDFVARSTDGGASWSR